ncbi:MAG TPA: serine O-acetyltransferase [Bdellovibrionales bacterium]|nr:MAG: serine O-acetyltransferase [Bdellovibrionales bacterium GWA1_52_35]OFZ36121.1 MAG: serine O-acetyltransferase [Bdellovibrionales bacterium GWC1_52_8]HAR44287.1 serine O-acetyltransferase [Bdellovibrionales bacterium]HCM40022.1 serine O-acetyltransferase [Bdellovibrionales bacterium]
MFYTIKQYRKYDPAAKGYLEVALLYPGVKAVFFHKIAHALSRAGIPFFPRLVSELSRFLTGIDIHPGATIGRGLIIDHGMGTVIGETAIIGNNVIIYQGVTLGGTELKHAKRHPTLEDHVVVGAGAKVLGNITIGSGSRIGANSVVIEDVPPNSTVVGIPAKRVRQGVAPGEELSHQKIKE